MESEHSHGPWHVGMRPGPIVYGPLGEQIADCRSISDDDETNRLNARLIAAAPAMYEALKAIQAWSFGQPWPCREMKQFTDIDAALAQAEGK